MKNTYNVHSTDLEEPQVQEHSTDLYELQVPEHSTDLDELQVQEHSKDRGERNEELTEVLPDFILKPFAILMNYIYILHRSSSRKMRSR